ncbi:MAG: hypothetical protein WKG01_29385 [Kofleriaceae bacterium]
MRPLVAIAPILVLGIGCSDPSAAPPPARPPIRADAGTIGPHHLFPTGGSDAVLATGAPDRGPEVPLTYAVPSRGSLVWTKHAYCEVDENLPICGDGPLVGLEHYRVGRAEGRIVVEQLRGTQIDTIWVYETAATGAPVRRLTLADGRRVAKLVTFGDRTFTSRLRTGANALGGCGRIGFSVDPAGRIRERRCLQWNGEPMRDEDGIAMTRTERDPRGFAVAQLRFGLDGKPATGRDFVHHLIYELDAIGRARTVWHRDLKEQPTASADGCFGWAFGRDAKGLPVRETCLGADQRPIASVRGVAAVAARFDVRGCQIAERNLGPTDEPVVDDDRVHGTDFVRDAQCRELERRCIGLDDKPMACEPGAAAREVTQRDAAGREVAIRHYRADGKPGRDRRYSVFELHTRWDDRDRAVTVTCHDRDGSAIDCRNTGFHGARSTYDDAGREIERRFFDATGASTHNRGTKLRRFGYDSYDHLAESATGDDAGGEPEFNGASVRRDLYDAYHRRFAVLMFDRKSTPAMYTSCFAGVTCPDTAWHAVRVTRRADGRVETNLFFDVAGQLIRTVQCEQVACFE